jgi:glycosyltransferase involved in cell wall biosynthesis
MEILNHPLPLLCLNMIVKNESPIIHETLTKLLKKVQFDYWVISDTGSDDDTKEIIIDFFKKANIAGELFVDEWKDFGHNRTLALEHAFNKSKYLMIFDADDEIIGDFVLPELTCNSYHLQFGATTGISYTRTQIINNHTKWKYAGVLHEYIVSIVPITNTDVIIKGDYYINSGKFGDRTRNNTDKYLKDALILERAYEVAIQNNDYLYSRYGFYCANSYFDYGQYENAILWYKKTLDNQTWIQEKYVSCLRLYNCYNSLNQRELGFFYLVKSAEYDKERTECLYELISYYCCNELNEVAYGYYTIIKHFYETSYLMNGLNQKLFLDVGKSELYLPYYMIIVCDRVREYNSGIQMFRIIFTKKYRETSKFYIGNMLFNLQFFIGKIKEDELEDFKILFKEYIDFLISIDYPVFEPEFMHKYEKYGIINTSFSEPSFSTIECINSKKILFYSGFAPFKWNNSFSETQALGGSETAVACLSNNFSKEYQIYIAGEVEEETFDNITYIHFNNLANLIKTNAFHTIIISRYLNFYEAYKYFSAYQTFVWCHDVCLRLDGTDLSLDPFLTKWSSKITSFVCQTEWHKNNCISLYPALKDKIKIINNGIRDELFISQNKKISNTFVYTSCSERGLFKLIQLWPCILNNFPDATLTISSYNDFPISQEDNIILEYILNTPSITHAGKLNRVELYNLMSVSEYWLYTSYFLETSCITSLELLASEVICLYYPVGGLVNTLGDYGISVTEGNEINALLNLTNEQKNELKKNGKEYALSCSWKNRAIEWYNLIFSNQPQSIIENKNKNNNKNKNIAIFNSFNFHYEMYGYIIEYCKKNNHTLTIFTSTKYTLGWLDFYKTLFNDYMFQYVSVNNYCDLKDTFDITFVTTDDDNGFLCEWINDKCIVIEHTSIQRTPGYTFRIGTRLFINTHNDWVIPCFNIFKETEKTNMLDTDINITIIGGNIDYNYEVINRLDSKKHINLFILGRNISFFNKDNIKNQNIDVILIQNIETTQLFDILKKCDYILTDSTTNYDHINGISMSGNIPLSFSTLTPLIISKNNNSIYKFKNVIEFNINSSDKIFVDKNVINIHSLDEERIKLSSMLEDYLIKNNVNTSITNTNTALIIDPRDDINLVTLIHDYQIKLGNNWVIVFYCGKGLKNKMIQLLNSNIEVRELNITNFTLNEYSDFMKNKDLWETLYGTFVLTFQLDAYILNSLPYNIDYFMNMDKSYIGGNMEHEWSELTREKIFINYRNFNGGLSLRKRLDMIKIIQEFGTNTTVYNSLHIQTDPEDVYFTLGCYKLQLPIGDTHECMHFCINRIVVDGFFGVHKPIPKLLETFRDISNIYCPETNRFILKKYKN